MARFKMAGILLLFFGYLSTNTYFRWVDALGINSRADHIMQGIVDSLMTSWMGDTVASLTLAAIAIFSMKKALNPNYEAQAQINLNSTSSALKGKVYKPTETELAATKQPIFGKK